MVIFGLFGHKDKTFFIFWYKSKQDALIEVTIVKKKIFFWKKALPFIFRHFVDYFVEYYRLLMKTFSVTNLDTLYVVVYTYVGYLSLEVGR